MDAKQGILLLGALGVGGYLLYDYLSKQTPCTSNTECGAGKVCSGGACIEAPPNPPCVQNSECTGGRICSQGTCVCTGNTVWSPSLGQCVVPTPDWPKECPLCKTNGCSTWAPDQAWLDQHNKECHHSLAQGSYVAPPFNKNNFTVPPHTLTNGANSCGMQNLSYTGVRGAYWVAYRFCRPYLLNTISGFIGSAGQASANCDTKVDIVVANSRTGWNAEIGEVSITYSQGAIFSFAPGVEADEVWFKSHGAGWLCAGGLGSAIDSVTLTSMLEVQSGTAFTYCSGGQSPYGWKVEKWAYEADYHC